MLFAQSDMKNDAAKHGENARISLIYSLQNDFFGLETVKNIPIVLIKNATLNEASILYRIGRTSVFFLYSSD